MCTPVNGGPYTSVYHSSGNMSCSSLFLEKGKTPIKWKREICALFLDIRAHVKVVLFCNVFISLAGLELIVCYEWNVEISPCPGKTERLYLAPRQRKHWSEKGWLIDMSKCSQVRALEGTLFTIRKTGITSPADPTRSRHTHMLHSGGEMLTGVVCQWNGLRSVSYSSLP